MNTENRWVDLVDKFKYSLRWVCCKIQWIDSCFLTTKVTITRDNWNWAGRKDTEIHGAAIRITTAVDVTLCWRQVTDTQSSNYRNERGGARSVTICRQWLPPATAKYQKSISYKGPFYSLIALWGKSVKWNESVWACLHLRFSQSGQSSDSLGKFCLHSPYKDSDLVS